MSNALDIIRIGQQMKMGTDHATLSQLVALAGAVEDQSGIGRAINKQRRRLATAINPDK